MRLTHWDPSPGPRQRQEAAESSGFGLVWEEARRGAESWAVSQAEGANAGGTGVTRGAEHWKGALRKAGAQEPQGGKGWLDTDRLRALSGFSQMTRGETWKRVPRPWWGRHGPPHHR